MGKTKSPRSGHSVRLIEYILPGDWKVLAGRMDADNEHLSLRVARPDDWWFHVRRMPGSHVILQGPPGEDADRQTLKRAAAIAAYHSKARQAGVVAVSCMRARYVTKARDPKVGTVQIRKEVVFKGRPTLGEQRTTSGDGRAAKKKERPINRMR